MALTITANGSTDAFGVGITGEGAGRREGKARRRALEEVCGLGLMG